MACLWINITCLNRQIVRPMHVHLYIRIDPCMRVRADKHEGISLVTNSTWRKYTPLCTNYSEHNVNLFQVSLFVFLSIFVIPQGLQLRPSFQSAFRWCYTLRKGIWSDPVSGTHTHTQMKGKLSEFIWSACDHATQSCTLYLTHLTTNKVIVLLIAWYQAT